MKSTVKFEDYSISISTIPSSEGGGFLASIPDCPGCIADGNTIDEAISEVQYAFEAWSMAEQEDKGELPAPKIYSGQFVQRIPKSMHRKLAKRAELEGVSLNQLTTTLLAEGLSRPQG